jgi:hypothetical protein
VASLVILYLFIDLVLHGIVALLPARISSSDDAKEAHRLFIYEILMDGKHAICSYMKL